MRSLPKLDIAFVILNYNTYNETNNLISSIETNIDTASYMIVVVDNCSTEVCSREIDKEYVDNEKIKIIYMEDNVGFARGNNEGISWVRKHCNVEYICCLNSDTIVQTKNLIEIVNNEYMRSNAAVIGPRILLKDNTIQETAYKLRSIRYYKRELEIQKNFLDQYSRGTKKPHGIMLMIKMSILKPIVMRCYEIKVNIRLRFRQNDRVLHGCCLFFTPAFFKAIQGFNPRTFLYREEELLYLSIMKKNLHSLYTPKLQIMHLEDAATNTVVNTDDEKMIFKAEHQIDSLNILIGEMNMFMKKEF